jgi:hypothetical protein
MIIEIRRFWENHPKYADLAQNIQGKYSFEERPSYGIIVKTSGGTKVDLAADNYIGIVQSYVFMTKVQNFPGLAVEWVREDARAIQNNGGMFPSPPGIYYLDLTGDEEFYVDRLYDVQRENPQITSPTTAQLARPPLAGTLRLFELPAAYMLVEGTNYTLTLGPDGKPTGEIVLTTPLTTGRGLSADYRYPGETSGPHSITPNFANNTVIPGVVIAFGNRNRKGDRIAVVVQPTRQPAALEYGGRWDITFDIDVMARDVDSQQEIADFTVVYLWGIVRSKLSKEGIEMSDLSLGGESEEVYDENGDDYFYNSNFSLTLQTDWSIHVPLALYLRQAVPLTPERSALLASLPDDQAHSVQSSIEAVEALGLEAFTDPFFAGRNTTFETIK